MIQTVVRRVGWVLAAALLLGAGRARADLPVQARINLAWQIALDAAGFSPGILDGHFGRKSDMAVKEFAARYFPNEKPLGKKVYDALKVDVEHAEAAYTVTDDDAMAVGKIPEDWNAKAAMTWLPYESLADCLTEKFHCTRALLERMNPGVNLAELTVGQKLEVPNLRPFPAETVSEHKPVPAPPKRDDVSYLTVNLTEKAIRAFDKNDREVALFHCSIARDKAKLPARDAVIKHGGLAIEKPVYTFDPDNWPEVHNVDKVLQIPAGPRNPIGLAWMGLDLPGYGIHGNPKPELIGKTGSHGCFRLTNWDALRLASMVHEGMVVKMVNPETQPATEE